MSTGKRRQHAKRHAEQRDRKPERKAPHHAGRAKAGQGRRRRGGNRDHKPDDERQRDAIVVAHRAAERDRHPDHGDDRCRRIERNRELQWARRKTRPAPATPIDTTSSASAMAATNSGRTLIGLALPELIGQQPRRDDGDGAASTSEVANA